MKPTLRPASTLALARIIAATALIVLAGCTTPIGTYQLGPRQAYLRLHQNAVNRAALSGEARVVLHRYNLDKTYKRDPGATIRQLHEIACTDDRRDLLYALSELSFMNAQRLSRSVRAGEPQQARDYYFASAIYAYLYLFGESREAPPDAYDLRFRAACDFYNRGLALGLMANASLDGVVELPGGPRQTPPGPVELEITQPGIPMKLDRISRFLSADEFAVRGLTTRNRDSGLGAPLIAVCKKLDTDEVAQRFPATVFLRVKGDVRSWTAGKMTASLELYSTYDPMDVQVNGKTVPLQTDTTAPIAQALNNSRVWGLGMAQFLSPLEKSKVGIRASQPYVPGRIPVVFVHGTAESAVLWAEILNTLRADAVLRQRYQFWSFSYNSGNPITYSAGLLREDLMAKVNELDPEGRDPALRQMVVIGHSQGGLLAKLTATDTGDKLWRLVSDKNIDQMDVDPQTREMLRTNFFFQPLPCVKRVIFVATPHRGSYRNTPLVQKLAAYFMTLPEEIGNARDKLLRLENDLRLPDSVRNGVPTSLSGMTTNNPFMLALADIPVAPGIKANSIVAIKGEDQPPNGDDGIVKYTSAHVDYVESEFIVRDVHGCMNNPFTIEEVRRILLKHLEWLKEEEHARPLPEHATGRP